MEQERSHGIFGWVRPPSPALMGRNNFVQSERLYSILAVREPRSVRPRYSTGIWLEKKDDALTVQINCGWVRPSAGIALARRRGRDVPFLAPAPAGHA